MIGRTVVLLALLAAAGVAQSLTRAVPVTMAGSLADVPMKVDSWTGYRAAVYEPNVVNALGVDQYIHRTYADDDGQVANLYVGYHRSQAQGASIHSPLNCMPGSGWESVRVERIPFAGGTARRVLIRKGTTRLMVVYWYQSAMRLEGDEYLGRFYTLLDTIRYGRNDAALVRVTVAVDDAAGGETRASDAAIALANRLVPHLSRVLFPPVAPSDLTARNRS